MTVERGQVDPRHLALRAIAETLRSGKASAGWQSEWLQPAYAAPSEFAAALHAYVSTRRGGTLKSKPGEPVNVYHDLVVMNLGRPRNAVVGGSERDPEELSYDGLHARTSALAAAWTREGLAPGDHVCVVLPEGVTYAVAVLTALRMGLIVSCVAPEGPAHVVERLRRLDPTRVVAGEAEARWLGRFAERALSTHPGERPGEQLGSHAYAPGDPVLRGLSPFRSEVALPCDVSACRLHVSLLAASNLVFNLEPGDVLAAPGFDPAQWQPTLLLATLAAGATFAALDLAEMANDPRLLERRHVTVLGVNRTLRDTLLPRAEENFRPASTAWFRALNEVHDTERWDLFGKAMSARKILGFAVFANATSGGARLWAPRGSDAVAPRVWPVPGEPWQLSEVGTPPDVALATLGTTGAFTPLLGDDATEPDLAMPRIVMGKASPAGFAYAGATPGGPFAHSYAEREVAHVAERFAGVRHAAAIQIPGPWLNDVAVVLLLFTDGPVGLVSLPNLRAHLTRQLGGRPIPDKMEIYPLRPSLDEQGRVDLSWARSQYLNGTLLKKSRSDLFRVLSELRYIFADAVPADG